MTQFISILVLQFLHALLRTSAIKATAKDKLYLVIVFNIFANLVRLFAISFSVLAILESNFIMVFALILGQGLGDFISIKYLKLKGE